MVLKLLRFTFLSGVGCPGVRYSSSTRSVGPRPFLFFMIHRLQHQKIVSVLLSSSKDGFSAYIPDKKVGARARYTPNMMAK